jgi:hypothetical protein
MAASDVRNILLRAMFEPQFHSVLLADPERAFQDYNLTHDEREVLRKPTSELYRFLQAGDEPGLRLANEPPPPPTTVVVVIVVAIVVFVAAASSVDPLAAGGVEKFAPLLNAIRTARGPARFDLVKTLVNELTRGQ